MKMKLRPTALAACLLLAAAGSLAAQTPDERVPQLDAAQEFPRWLRQVRVDGIFLPGEIETDPNKIEIAGTPSIAVDSKGIVHMVFSGLTHLQATVPNNVPDVFYTHNRYKDRRANGWAPPVNVSQTVGSSKEPDIAIGPDDTPHIVWVEDRVTIWHATISYSDTTGVGVLTDVTTLSSHHQPAISVSGTSGAGTAHVVATGYNNMIAYTNKGGGSWSAAADITGSLGGTLPRVHHDSSGNAHAAYIAAQRLVYSRNIGAWSTFTNNSSVAVQNVDLFVASDNKTHFVWDTQNISDAGATTIKYSTMVSGGSVFTTTENVSTLGGFMPRIVVDSRLQPHVNWIYNKPQPHKGISYAERVNRGDIGVDPWKGRQEPTSTITRDGFARLEIAINANDNIFMCFDVADFSVRSYSTKEGYESGKQPGNPPNSYDSDTDTVTTGMEIPIITETFQVDAKGAVFFSKMIELNLGPQDSYGMIGFAPNTVGNAATGDLTYSLPLFTAAGVGIGTDFALTYNTHEWQPGPMSQGWTTSYHVTMTDHRDGGVKSIQFGSGQTLVYTNQTGTVCPEKEFGEFSYFSSGLTRKTKGGIAYDFDLDTGKLTRVTDTNLNQLNLTYINNAQGMKGQLQNIQDSASRPPTVLSYTNGYLTQVQDPGGKTYALAYDSDPVKPKLITITRNGPPAIAWQFTYHTTHNSGTGERKFLLKQLTTPRGNPWKFTYFQDNRLRDSEAPTLTQANLGGGNFRRFSYTSPVSPTATNRMVAKFKDRMDNESPIEIEYKRSLVRKVTDPLPFTTFIQQDFDGVYRNLTTFRDRSGSTKVLKYRHEVGGTETPSHVKDLVAQVFLPPANGSAGAAADTSKPFTETTYSNNIFVPLTTKDIKGNVTKYYYDGDGSYPADPNKDVIQGNLTKIGYPPVSGQSASEEWSFDGAGRILSHTTAENVGTSYQTTFSTPHSQTGLMTRILEPEHTSPRILDFHLMGFVISDTSPVGGITSYAPDGHYRITNVTYPPGDEVASMATTYDADGNVDTVTGPGPGFADNDYDEWGRLISRATTISTGVTAQSTMKYDAEGNVRESKDVNQQITTTTYDNLYRPDVTSSPGSPSVVVDNDYDSATGYLSATKVGTGGGLQTTSFTMTAWGAVKTTSQAGGVTDEVTYEERGLTDTTLRKQGGTTKFGRKSTLDEWGRVRASTQLTDFTALTGLTTSFTLDRNSNTIRVTDASGSTTSWDHDRADRRIRTKDHLLQIISETVFNENDLVDSIKAPHPETGALIVVAKHSYNLANQLKSVTDAVGNVTTFVYNSQGNRALTLLPVVGSTACTSRFEYDFAGRLIAQTHDPGLSTQVRWEYRYDLVGNRIKTIDPKGNVYQFRYDGMNRMVEMEYPPISGVSFVESWAFDSRGNQASHVDCEGKIATFGYDAQDRLISEVHVKAGVTLTNLTRTYDPGTSNLLTVTDSISKIKISFTDDAGSPGYDKLNRLTHVRWFLEAGTPQEAVWKKVFYVKADGSPAYDINGKLLRMVDPEGHVYDYAYDSMTRLSTITRTRKGGTATVMASIAYYGVSGLRKDLNLQGGARTTYHYDLKSRLSSIETAKSDGSMLARFDYVYDGRDRRTMAKMEHLLCYVTYTYDCVDRLTGETWSGNASLPPGSCTNVTQPLTAGNASGDSNTASAVVGGPVSVPTYTWTCLYDANGNRTSQTKNGTSTTYLYDAQNRLNSETTGAVTTTYGYDRNGNQISRTQGATTETFDPDYMNRVKAYRKVVSGSTTVSYQYRYTPTDERIAKVNLLTSSDNEEWFMCDGTDVTADYLKSTASASYQLKRTYVNGGSIDSKIAQIESGSSESPYFYLTDALGSVHELMDGSGNITRRVLDTAWGEPLPGFSPLTTIGTRYDFTQREADLESGVLHYRARSYDPRMGRFIHPDPIRFESGDPNFYCYVRNNPANKIDPTGLQAQSLQDANDQRVKNGLPPFTPEEWERMNDKSRTPSDRLTATWGGDGKPTGIWVCIPLPETAEDKVRILKLKGYDAEIVVRDGKRYIHTKAGLLRLGSVAGQEQYEKDWGTITSICFGIDFKNPTKEQLALLVANVFLHIPPTGGGGAAKVSTTVLSAERRAALGAKAAKVMGEFGEAAAELGGQLYGADRLAKLTAYMKKRGFTVVLDHESVVAGPRFGVFDAEKKLLYLRSTATEYHVWHELCHYLQYEELGFEVYSKLSKVAKEQFVFDFLINHKRWGMLSAEERESAIWYILKVGGIGP